MTKKEQIAFVKGLTKNIAESVVFQIKQGKIPENWDGTELRWLLEKRFVGAANLYQSNSAKRKRSFRNDVICNLL